MPPDDPVDPLVSIERDIAQLLRTALADVPIGGWIPESEPFRKLLCELEWFLGRLLRELPGYWQEGGECLDGVNAFRIDKTGEFTAELLGWAILISDQSVVPCHLQLELAKYTDEVSWLRCRLGETGVGEGKMMRVPYGSSAFKQLYTKVMEQRASLDWAYVFGYGTKCEA